LGEYTWIGILKVQSKSSWKWLDFKSKFILKRTV